MLKAVGIVSTSIRDDELEMLERQVVDLFGKEALVAARLRAMSATPASSASAEAIQDAFDRPTSITEEQASNIKTVSGAAFALALKAELRRLVTPQ